jgi:hypothetical protein
MKTPRALKQPRGLLYVMREKPLGFFIKNIYNLRV